MIKVDRVLFLVESPFLDFFSNPGLGFGWGKKVERDRQIRLAVSQEQTIQSRKEVGKIVKIVQSEKESRKKKEGPTGSWRGKEDQPIWTEKIP